MRFPERLAGAAFATAAASCFGVTIVVQRRLASGGLGFTTALGIRFAIAAATLLGLLALLGIPPVPVRGERARTLLLGVVGYATEAMVFYLALERGSAGAVALLFYAYPAFVVLLEAALRLTPLRLRTVAALVASTAGTALVVAGGGTVSISGTGVALALGSAGCFAVYLLASERLVRHSDPRVIGAWVAAGASAALLSAGALSGSLESPAGDLDLLAVNGVATAAAFALMYAALPRLGAGPTAVVMTMEAFVALLLAVPFLGERIGAVQLAGGVLIVAAAVAVAQRAGPGTCHVGPDRSR